MCIPIPSWATQELVLLSFQLHAKYQKLKFPTTSNNNLTERQCRITTKSLALSISISDLNWSYSLFQQITKLVMPTIVSLYRQGWSDWTMQKFLKSGLLQVDNPQILKVKSKTNRLTANKTLHSTSALNCNIPHHIVQARSDPSLHKWLWKVNMLLIFTQTCGPLQ